MSLFNVADKVHERQGSALTQAKGSLQDADAIIRDLNERVSALEAENRKLKTENSELRKGFDPDVARFSMELDKRANITKRFPSADEALKVVTRAVDAHFGSADIQPGEDVAAWRKGQLGL